MSNTIVLTEVQVKRFYDYLTRSPDRFVSGEYVTAAELCYSHEVLRRKLATVMAERNEYKRVVSQLQAVE